MIWEADMNVSTELSTVRRNPGLQMEISPHLVLPAFRMAFAPNEEIFGQEEEADFVYKVIDGAVRTSRLLSDGRRQIVGFHLPGDVFGLECGASHRFSAEAVVDTSIALVRRSTLQRALEKDPHAAQELWMLTSRELEALQEHMLVLSRKSASERVASFLLKLGRQYGSKVIELPMSRCDIADHLGLTLETVSRTLSQMSKDHVIQMVSARRLVLERPDMLEAA